MLVISVSFIASAVGAAEGEIATGRLAGDDRFATAVRIAAAAFPAGADRVYLARAHDYPDALAAGALTDGPILLVRTSGAIPPVVRDEIARQDPNEVIALGGPGAISEQTLAAAGAGRTTGRLAGKDRFATAVRIAAAAFPAGADRVYLARADDYPDALAAGALTDGPILLVHTSGAIPPVVRDEIARQDPSEVIALGGPGAISEQTLAAAGAGRTTGRLAGDDRFATAVRIAAAAFPAGADRVYLARADDYPDALAAGALTDGPILLVRTSGAISPVVRDEIARQDPNEVIALGGPGAISEQTLHEAASGDPAPAVRLSASVLVQGFDNRHPASDVIELLHQDGRGHVLRYEHEGDFVGVGVARWSPDGRVFAFPLHAGVGPNELSTLSIHDGDTGAFRSFGYQTSLPGNQFISGFAWSPRGDRAVIAETTGEVKIVDPFDGTVVQHLGRYPSPEPGYATTDLHWGDDDTIAFVVPEGYPESGRGQLWMVDPGSTAARAVTGSWTSAERPKIAPGGGRLAVEAIAGSSRTVQIVDYAGEQLQAIPGDFVLGEWTPDAQHLVVVDLDGGDVHRLDVATAAAERLTNLPDPFSPEQANAEQPVVSSDGTQVAFLTNDYGCCHYPSGQAEALGLVGTEDRQYQRADFATMQYIHHAAFRPSLAN